VHEVRLLLVNLSGVSGGSRGKSGGPRAQETSLSIQEKKMNSIKQKRRQYRGHRLSRVHDSAN